MALADWMPSVADVGAILRARTKDTAGNELGTFTEATRPNGRQVASYVEAAAADVEAQMGAIPEALQAQARRLTSIGAALFVELAHYPEMINTGRSPYSQLKELYDERFGRLAEAVENVNEGGTVGDDSTDTGSPSYFFPADLGGLVGWGSRW